MNVSQYISQTIAQVSGEYIFGVSGIPNLFLYQYLEQDLTCVQNIHEAHSIYAAMGAYQQTGKLHFSVVTAGPGITNCVTALAEAYVSNIPLVVISINNSSFRYGLGEHHDSTSIGGIDTVSICEKVTVGSSIVLSAENTVYVFEKLILKAMKEKKPVHISIPKDILEYDIPSNFRVQDLDIYTQKNQRIEDLNIDKITKVIYAISGSNTPFLINLGDNIQEDIFQNFIETVGIPFSNSMKNLNFCKKSLYHVGCFEYIQSESIQILFKKSDVIIIIGEEIKSFLIGNPSSWQGKTIVHISPVPFAQCQIFQGNYIYLYGEIEEIFEKISKNIFKKIQEESVVEIKDTVDLHYEKQYQDNLMYHTYQYLNTYIPKDSSVFVSVGGTNNFANVFLNPQHTTSIFMPSNFFNMGQSMKVIGYAMYNKKTPNFLLIGDGNFYMNNADILTAVEQKLNINIIVFNNKGYASLIKYGTSNQARQRYSANFGKYEQALDFEKYSESIGANYTHISSKEELEKGFSKMNMFQGINIIEVQTHFDDMLPL